MLAKWYYRDSNVKGVVNVTTLYAQKHDECVTTALLIHMYKPKTIVLHVHIPIVKFSKCASNKILKVYEKPPN